jgi:hypothetical protein
MLDQAEQDDKTDVNPTALRNAEYASLNTFANTDEARALVDLLYGLVIAEEARTDPRKRQRGTEMASAFRHAVEAFLGDLLRAAGRKDQSGSGGWAYRSISAGSFTGFAVTSHHFANIRGPLRSLGLVEEVPKFDQWTAFGLHKRWTTRFRATPKLQGLAELHGVSAAEASGHFILGLPERPLVRRAHSGSTMKIAYNGGLQAMEQRIKEFNNFIDQFDIRGGEHRGYIRVFHEGDHPSFNWNLGGRLYSQGSSIYQKLPRDERLKMTIAGEPVCELDIRASYLTIFQARRGRPLDRDHDPAARAGRRRA